jgi:hypothetical protein
MGADTDVSVLLTKGREAAGEGWQFRPAAGRGTAMRPAVPYPQSTLQMAYLPPSSWSLFQRRHHDYWQGAPFAIGLNQDCTHLTFLTLILSHTVIL